MSGGGTSTSASDLWYEITIYSDPGPDTDPSMANGVLTETPSKKMFLEKGYTLV